MSRKYPKERNILRVSCSCGLLFNFFNLISVNSLSEYVDNLVTLQQVKQKNKKRG